MAVAIQSVEYASTVTTRASLGLADADTSEQTVTRKKHNTSKRLTPGGTVPVAKDAYTEVTLVAGAATLDLTNLPGGETGNIDLTGLNVQILKVKAVDAAGTDTPHAVTAKQGASNGYTGGGSGWQAPATPGGEAVFYWNGGASVVGGANKTIDFTGTLAEKFLVCVVAG